MNGTVDSEASSRPELHETRAPRPAGPAHKKRRRGSRSFAQSDGTTALIATRSCGCRVAASVDDYREGVQRVRGLAKFGYTITSEPLTGMGSLDFCPHAPAPAPQPGRTRRPRRSKSQ